MRVLGSAGKGEDDPGGPSCCAPSPAMYTIALWCLSAWVDRVVSSVCRDIIRRGHNPTDGVGDWPTDSHTTS